MHILAIETSCDETSASVVKDGREVLSNIVASQIDIHAEYGGVVPEVAARAHTETIIPVVQASLREAGVSKDEIDSLAIVYGAGLMPSLLTGMATAKSLAFAWDKPLIPVNHIVAHVYANWIDKSEGEIKFPALALVVSGGHTDLHLLTGHLKFQRLGGTLDDAAGEAFDKVAKLLGLGYPGGPEISRRAEQGNCSAFDFPRGLIKQDNFDFSFSGLKTAVIYKVRELEKKQKEKMTTEQINDICASFEKAVIDVLVSKALRAAEHNNVSSVLLAGGVAANKLLRKTMTEELHKKLSDVKYYQPELPYCMDNAAMVGVAAYYQQKYQKIKWDWREVEAEAGLRVE
ncbi:tRNA (adenosine(37)-N6)-threonylcarbamoyltransferase complex transferase subunit TsaD [Patescibacteria group bacterium]